LQLHVDICITSMHYRCSHGRCSALMVFWEKFQKWNICHQTLSQSECQWYHMKACLKSFTMSTNVEWFW
jgi:hypothetical protein